MARFSYSEIWEIINKLVAQLFVSRRFENLFIYLGWRRCSILVKVYDDLYRGQYHGTTFTALLYLTVWSLHLIQNINLK